MSLAFPKIVVDGADGWYAEQMNMWHAGAGFFVVESLYDENKSPGVPAIMKRMLLGRASVVHDPMKDTDVRYTPPSP